METKDITFVIVTFHSEKVIFDCLDLLPEDSRKIIIENSKNINLKEILEKKYPNLKCYLMEENLGYGKGNNIGINFSQTEFVFILNPDVRFKSSDINKFLKIVSSEKFVIAAPVENKELKLSSNQNNYEDVNSVKGFAMLLNKKSLNKEYFDENIFLYLEEIDLCKRVKDKKGRIIRVNVPIIHLGASSHGDRANFEMEKSRNWHWMWSRFYFSKKYKGYFLSYIIFFPILFKLSLKLVFHFIFRDHIKFVLCKKRIFGLFTSILGKRSYYRPKI